MTDQPPLDHAIPKLNYAKSLVVVNTGHGKGKSCAAMGIMIRAVARGWKVAVIQFLKSPDRIYGEQRIGEQLGVAWWSAGDGFTWDSEDIDETQALAIHAWQDARKLIESAEYQLVILDEVSYPVMWDWISADEVAEVLVNRPDTVSVVLTGRDMPAPIIAVADTVTDMTEVKHPYRRGIGAKKGIDF